MRRDDLAPPRPAARRRRVRAREPRGLAARLPCRRRRAPRRATARRAPRPPGALEMLTAGLQSRVVDVRSLFVSSRVGQRERVHRLHAADGRPRPRQQPQLAAEGDARRPRAAVERELGAKITTLSPDGAAGRGHDARPGLPDPLRRARHPRPLGRRLQRLHACGPPRGDRARDRLRPPDLDHRCWTSRAPEQRGFVLYAPVYKSGGRHRMEDVVGVVAGSFSVADARRAVAARGRARDRRARAARGRGRPALGSRRSRRPDDQLQLRGPHLVGPGPAPAPAAGCGSARSRSAPGMLLTVVLFCWPAGRAPAAACSTPGAATATAPSAASSTRSARRRSGWRWSRRRGRSCASTAPSATCSAGPRTSCAAGPRRA